MVIVVFRTHVKPQADLGKLNALSQEMVALVSKMPGFLSIKDFSAQDGEFLVIAEFDSLESIDAWKAHPEHLVAQRHSRIRTIGNLDWTAARPNQGVHGPAYAFLRFFWSALLSPRRAVFILLSKLHWVDHATGPRASC